MAERRPIIEVGGELQELPAGDTTIGTPLYFGNESVGASTTTRYLTPGYEDEIAETVELSIILTRVGELANFYVTHGVGGGNGNDIDYTVRLDGVDTALTVALASTATGPASDLVNTVVNTAGQKLSISVTKALGIGGGPTEIQASVEWRS